MKQDYMQKKQTKTNNHTLTSLITSCNIKKIKLDIIQYSQWVENIFISFTLNF